MDENNGFEIPAKLPGLNEIIGAARSGWATGAKQKRDTETLIGFYINQAKRKHRLRAVKEPIEIWITWQERTRRRDVDNIEAGAKFILDAMKNAGIIIDDSRKYVRQVRHEITDGKTDKVFVKIIKIPIDK